MRKSKARKPAFDVAHADIGDATAGWVYRSSPPQPVVIDVPTPAAPAPTPRPSSERQSTDASPAWVEAGARVLVFPLACALVAMAAPVLWMLSPRARQ